MKNRVIIIALFSLVSTGIFAQVNTGVLYNNNFNLKASRYLPALLGEDRANVQVGVLNAWAWGQNSSLTWQDLNPLLNGNDWQQADISSILAALKTNNSMQAGVLVEPLNAAFRVNKNEKKEYLTIGFGVAEIINTEFLYSKTLADIAWNGNAAYAGQNAQLGPAGLNATYNREFFLALSVPIVQLNTLKVRIGGRIKGIHGLAAVVTEKANAELFTDADGKFIELTHDYYIKTAFKEKFNGLTPSGRGWGYDLGAGAILFDRLHVYAGVIGTGQVTFNQNIRNYSGAGYAKFQGIGVTDIFNEIKLDDSPLIDELLNNTEDHAPFTLHYAPQLVLQAALRKPGVTLLGNRFYKRNLFITYVQDFAGSQINTSHSNLSVAYSRDFASVLNLGISGGLEDLKYPSLGAFIGLRVLMLRFGASSSNLLPVIFKNTGKHADLGVQVSVAF